MYSYEEALKAGRELEKLGYKWLEEPLLDVDLHSLKKLREKLDIPICGTEVIAGNNYSVANCIKDGIVDIVRTDVSWRAGITAVMKTAHLAESCEFIETLYPFDDFNFGTKSQLNIVDGYVMAPEGEGLCIDYDWDFIDKHTVAIL
jgi:L-alanine-DL-glutamate epimerase-like enolase superfamily enzyme